MTNPVTSTLAEYGFVPDADEPNLYRRPDRLGVLHYTDLAEHGKHALSLWPSSLTHPDPVVAVRTLMALCGIERVEVLP